MAYLGLATYALRAAHRWRVRRENRRTRRIVEGLPASIRKDIGWPDPDMRIDTSFRL